MRCPLKLIEQTILHFQSGSSDKVYEVELCEVGANKYVVNFRYGKRGASLTEGSKTKSPVTLAEARRVFNDLVASKTKKGYQDVSAPQAAASLPPAAPANTASGKSARDAILLSIIKSGKDGENISLTRAVWRAGEVELKGATPALLALIGHRAEKLLDYCVAWTLGRCGDNSALGPLLTIVKDKKASNRVARIAQESARQILSRHGGLDDFIAEQRDALPLDLREAHARQDAAYFERALALYLKGATGKKHLIYSQLYLIDDQVTRPAILNYLKSAPVNTPHMRVMRHLLKAAELRLDAQVFGLIMYRLTKSEANYKVSSWSANSWGKADDKKVPTSNSWIGGTYTPHAVTSLSISHKTLGWRNLPIKEVQADDSVYAFSSATKAYMVRRAWRTLNRLGKLDSEAYVKMAVGVLLPYRDEDAVPVRRNSYSYYDYSSRRYISRTSEFGPWAPFKPFNHVLFQNSKLQGVAPNDLLWKFKPGHSSTDKTNDRQEAFPHLWDKAPVGLLHLIDESRCEVVHEFAATALKQNKKFCDQLPIDVIIMMLESPYEVTARLGFELFERRYDPDHPDLEALVKVATCAYKMARDRAISWLGPHQDVLVGSPALLVTLMLGPAEGRAFSKVLLRARVLPEPIAQDLIARAIAAMLALGAKEEAHDAIKDAAELLVLSLGNQLRVVGFSIIKDLLEHPLEALQVLAGELLILKELSLVPDQFLEGLLGSPHIQVRALGMRLFSQLSEAQLLDREQLLVALIVHELPDLRQAARSSVGRLAKFNSDFAHRIVSLLTEALLLKERVEGTHADILRLLREELADHLTNIPKAKIYALLRSQGSAAKDLGGLLLQLSVNPSELELLEIVELGRHEILSVREACWKFMAASLPRILADKPTALRVADSDWEDTRKWAFAFFEAQLKAQDWTPELLVSLCDSVRYDVQAWGKRMIQTHFEEEQGDVYLLRLSEHPSPDLQLFATNYLERFASDNIEHLDRLEFYFCSILSRVNRGGVAKARVFDFLDQEAQKSEDAAQLIGAILGRQSLTITIRDRARAIETMTRIRQLYPNIQLPLELVPVEVRHGV